MENLEELTPGELSRQEKGQALSRSVFFNSDRNYGTLKRYGETGYKVTFIFNYVEADHTRTHTAKGQAENETKLENNLARAKARVFELAACNPWELFITFTLDPAKYDRYNLPQYQKELAHYLRNWRMRQGDNIRYLLIPERHADGAWHMHGFLMGLPVEKLHRFNLSETLPSKIRNRIQQGKAVYTWQAYANKFGFADIEPIENREASAKYISKYVTKDTMRSVTDFGAHIFYASKGLQGAETICKGDMFAFPEKPSFRSDFCAIQWYKTEEEARQCFP